MKGAVWRVKREAVSSPESITAVFPALNKLCLKPIHCRSMEWQKICIVQKKLQLWRSGWINAHAKHLFLTQKANITAFIQHTLWTIHICIPYFMVIHPVVLKTFDYKTAMSSSWWWHRRSQKFTKAIRIHPLGIMNVHIGNPMPVFSIPIVVGIFQSGPTSWPSSQTKLRHHNSTNLPE